MKLIDNAGQAWRFASVRLIALGTTLLGFVTLFPDAALQAWLLLPPEFKNFLSPRYLQYVSIGIFVCSILARVVKQPKLEPPPILDMPAKPSTGLQNDV